MNRLILFIISMMPIIAYTQEDCGLPSIHFDKNTSIIKQEFVKDLNDIGLFLIENPSKKLCITGHDLKNPFLGIKRAEKAMQFLIQDCKIDLERLQIDYIYRYNIDPHNRLTREIPSLDYLNGRVDFECM